LTVVPFTSSFPKKVLIFTSDYGGHEQTSRVIKAVFEKNFPNVEVQLRYDADKLWPGGGYAFQLHKNFVQKSWTRAAAVLTSIGKKVIAKKQASFVKAFDRIVDREKPDLIVSVLPLINSALVRTAENKHKPFLLVSSDLDPRLYLYKMPIHTEAQFKVALAFSCHEIASKIIPSDLMEQVSFTGYPVRAEFCKKYTDWEKTEFKKELHIPNNKAIVSIALGSLGASTTHTYVRNLYQAHQSRKITQPVHYAALCGYNKELFDKLCAWARSVRLQMQFSSQDPRTVIFQDKKTGFSISLVGFCKDFYKYLAASDVFFTKTGSGSINEAIYIQVPIVTADAFGQTPWEVVNSEIVEKYGLGRRLLSFKDLARVMIDL
jgi:UDP-N-acetylglucosamine:LPS N-acetylglucosamine transferase